MAFDLTDLSERCYGALACCDGWTEWQTYVGIEVLLHEHHRLGCGTAVDFGAAPDPWA